MEIKLRWMSISYLFLFVQRKLALVYHNAIVLDWRETTTKIQPSLLQYQALCVQQTLAFWVILVRQGQFSW